MVCNSADRTDFFQLLAIFCFGIVDHSAIGNLISLYVAPPNVPSIFASCESAISGGHIGRLLNRSLAQKARPKKSRGNET